MTIPRFDTEGTFDNYKDEYVKDYIDDFNSNDSYDPDKPQNNVVAYRNFNKSKTLLIDDDHLNGRVQTEYVLEQKNYNDTEDLLSGKASNLSKKSSQRKDASPLVKYVVQKTEETPEKETREDPFKIPRPMTSYKKKGMITKVNINDEGRDLLAGRRKLMKRQNLNKAFSSK